jgi:hypothetical protein
MRAAVMRALLQFAALIKTDLAKFARIIKTANIKLEN